MEKFTTPELIYITGANDSLNTPGPGSDGTLGPDPLPS